MVTIKQSVLVLHAEKIIMCVCAWDQDMRMWLYHHPWGRDDVAANILHLNVGDSERREKMVL